MINFKTLKTLVVLLGFTQQAFAGPLDSVLAPTSLDVVIPAGESKILASSFNVSTLTISGTLSCKMDPTAVINIRAKRISVTKGGKFNCGSVFSPFPGKLTITLTGSKEKKDVLLEERAFFVLDGGIIDMHGIKTQTWTKLVQTGTQGSTRLFVAHKPKNWAPGDQIAILSTSTDFRDAEIATIKSVNGFAVDIEQPLKNNHFSSMQTYYPPWKPEGIVLDEKAEVIRLTRNILIQGDDDVVVDYGNRKGAIGGHFMVGMTDPNIRPLSAAYITNVEFNRLGKTGFKGRYSLHLHLLQDATGQFINSNSIHHSFQRCIVVHATSNMQINDNTCFDHFGHGLFLEEGSEMNNLIDGNLIAGTKSIHPDIAVLATDSDNTASYWIQNGQNTITNNVAGGGEFEGFWFAIPAYPIGFSKQYPELGKGLTPWNQTFGVFANNTAHSNNHVNFAIDTGVVDNEVAKFPTDGGPLYAPTGQYKWSNITSYMANFRALWLRTSPGFRMTVENLVSADNRNISHFFSAWGVNLNNALFVGKSDNPDAVDDAQGVTMYDGPINYNNLHFENFFNTEAIGLTGAFTKFRSRFRKVSFKNVVKKVKMDLKPHPQPPPKACRYCAIPEYFDSILEDMDGSISGIPNTTIIPKMDYGTKVQHINGDKIHIHPASCKAFDEYGAWQCQGVSYGVLQIGTPAGTPNSLPAIYVTRSDGIQAAVDCGGMRNLYQLALITNKGLSYTIDLAYKGAPLLSQYRLNFGNLDSPNAKVYVTIKGLKPGSKATVNSDKNAFSPASFLLDELAFLSSKTTSFFKVPFINDLKIVFVADKNDPMQFDAFDNNKPWGNYYSNGITITV